MLKISRKFLLNIQMSVLLGAVVSVLAQPLAIAQEDSFRDMDDLLPSPNSYRTASGRPGVAYWQQKADYKIDATLDAEAKRVIGSEEMLALPADIWRRYTGSIEKLFVRSKPIVEVAFDPNRETLDTGLSNNLFPQKIREAILPLSFDEKENVNQMIDTFDTVPAAEPPKR
jgi:hypothetical protein